MRILVIEDEYKIANSIKKGLEQESFAVDLAYEGIEGYDLAASEDHDVIVLDLKMPGLDGLATLERIRQKDLLTPVILLTGHIDFDRVTQVLNRGAAEVLLKPCPIETLVSAIENACEMKAIAREVDETRT